MAEALGRGGAEGSPPAKRKQKAAATAVGPIRPLSWAIDNGRIVYLGGKSLAALDLKTGEDLWTVPGRHDRAANARRRR